MITLDRSLRGKCSAQSPEINTIESVCDYMKKNICVQVYLDEQMWTLNQGGDFFLAEKCSRSRFSVVKANSWEVSWSIVVLVLFENCLDFAVLAQRVS